MPTSIPAEQRQLRAERRIASLDMAFEDARVTGYEALNPAMTNDAQDRRVLAAAVRCRAHALVTQIARHFPESSVGKPARVVPLASPYSWGASRGLSGAHASARCRGAPPPS